jgi:hypothetical protein
MTVGYPSIGSVYRSWLTCLGIVTEQTTRTREADPDTTADLREISLIGGGQAIYLLLLWAFCVARQSRLTLCLADDKSQANVTYTCQVLRSSRRVELVNLSATSPPSFGIMIGGGSADGAKGAGNKMISSSSLMLLVPRLVWTTYANSHTAVQRKESKIACPIAGQWLRPRAAV